MGNRLSGKRVLITQADEFMGPVTAEVFAEEGAEVVTDTRDLRRPGAAAELIADSGHIDVLIANLAANAQLDTPAVDISDDDWAVKFDVMVHPLHRLVRAVLPGMIERRAGKVVVYGSASGLRGTPGTAAYAAARSAQVGYVRSVGAEAAPHNVQINLIAQNFVENPAYYPPETASNPRFLKALARVVPAGRLASAREDALLAVFLASEESNFIVGTAIPFAGGWVQ